MYVLYHHEWRPIKPGHFDLLLIKVSYIFRYRGRPAPTSFFMSSRHSKLHQCMLFTTPGHPQKTSSLWLTFDKKKYHIFCFSLSVPFLAFLFFVIVLKGFLSTSMQTGLYFNKLFKLLRGAKVKILDIRILTYELYRRFKNNIKWSVERGIWKIRYLNI